MKFISKVLLLAATIVSGSNLLGSNAAHADLSYTCDPSISAATCAYMNTTIAALYNNTFTNINANMYVTLGTTGLGQGEGIFNYNQLSYSSYVAAYTANAAASGNAAQTSGLTSLNTFATPIYNGTNVSLSGALAQALGVAANNTFGFSSSGTPGCSLTSAGCYEDVITITNDPGTPLYYRTGGPIASDAYDFYSVLEHETDEGLGTQSCIDTQDITTLDNNCSGTGNESASDLFRYQSPGNLVDLNVPDASLPTTPGAYLSTDGGVTNSLGSGRFYNTLINGSDYGDFDTSNNVCSGGTVPDAVQDETGCPGVSGLDIDNDGGPEIAMLNAVGFDLRSNVVSTPEPISLAILFPAVVALVRVRRRR